MDATTTDDPVAELLGTADNLYAAAARLVIDINQARLHANSPDPDDRDTAAQLLVSCETTLNQITALTSSAWEILPTIDTGDQQP